MTPAELDRMIDQSQFPSLLYLYGEEKFLLERSLKKLLDKAIPVDARDFNLSVFHCKDFSADRLLESVRTYPIFFQRRVVLVKDAHLIPAPEIDRLLSYIHAPISETMLIFISEKIDGRRKFFVEFKKYGELVEFKKIYDNHLPAVVRGLARQEDLTLTDAALALFCKRVGSNLQDVYTELIKLGAFLGEGRLADVADVAAVVSGTRQESVFALNEAIGDRQTQRAIKLVAELLDERVPALLILSMMVKHMRCLCKVHEMVSQKSSRAEIAKVAEVNPYFLDGLIRQSRNFPSEGMPRVFEKLLETDLALKSAGAHPAVLLERAVTIMCTKN